MLLFGVPLSHDLTISVLLLSGNVVWLDNMTTTRALVQLSYDVEHVPDFSEGDREPRRPRTSKPQAQEERMETDLAGPGSLSNQQPIN